MFNKEFLMWLENYCHSNRRCKVLGHPIFFKRMKGEWSLQGAHFSTFQTLDCYDAADRGGKKSQGF
jgi:hypothetical protein